MTLALSTLYHGKDLAMMQTLPKDLQNVWKRCPVKFTDREAQSACLDAVISLMQQTDAHSPSRLAAIKAEDIVSPLLKTLNADYRKSMETYKRLLKVATLEDCRSILQYKQKYKIFFNFAVKFFSKVKRDVRAFRYAWVVRVHTLELNRLLL